LCGIDLYLFANDLRKSFANIGVNMSIKLTGYRKEILNILEEQKKPLQAKDILELMQDKPDLSTVYRGLEFLSKKNYVKFIAFFDNTRLFFTSNSSHNHFIHCVKCHSTQEFDDCCVGNFEHNIADKFDFKIKDHFLYFTGVCKSCREKYL